MDQIQFNFASLLLVLTVFQGGTYALFLLTRAQTYVLPSRLLGVFTLCFSLHFGNILLIEFGPLPAQPNFNPVFGFCYGPLLWLFVRSLVEPRFRLRPNLNHFWAPTLAVPVIWLSDRYLASPLTLISLTQLIHLIVYVWLARRTASRFKRSLQEQFSAIDTVNLDWLRRLLNQVLFLVLITIVHFAFQAAGYQQVQSNMTLLIFVSVLYFINALVLKGMSHPSMELWLDRVAPRHRESSAKQSSAAIPEIESSDSEQRYLGSGLTTAQSKAYFQRLQELMGNNEPYLDENLNIHQLAESLQTSAKHLSQVINQNSEQSFYDYINGFRIDKAKALLRDPQHAQMRVSQVMYEVGYSAKSTFNSLFKQTTGMTPTEYRRRSP